METKFYHSENAPKPNQPIHIGACRYYKEWK